MDQFASPRFNSRVSQCEGKVAFRGQGIAKAAANRRKGRVAYRCGYCFRFHVGTRKHSERNFTKRNKLIRLFLETELEIA